MSDVKIDPQGVTYQATGQTQPPLQGVYPPPQQGYPPPQQGYPPPQQGYPPPQPGFQPGYQQQPVVAQPGIPMQGGEQWMPVTQPPPTGCPPGLEYFTVIDQLIVKQQIELLEAFTGWETSNKYKVKNSIGQNVFFAVEDTDCCNRQCCGPARSFDIKILDNNNQEVVHLNRPLRCQECCFPCCLQELEVSSPPGTPIGYVIQQWSIFHPKFEVQDAQRNPVLLIEGPICTCRCGDVEFKVMSLDGVTQVGRISKQWMGLLREAFVDADTFGITFPMDLDVKVKATMLGATFLIDFMYFETQNQNQNN